MPSGPPPDEPTLRSSPCLLSPTSPKPIHFPTPTNIPILEMQNDVDFNQTELHMNDPAMHNTELRPGAWKDPSETREQGQEEPSPAASAGHTTGRDSGEDAPEAGAPTEPDGVVSSDGVIHSAQETASIPDASVEPNGILNDASDEANAAMQAQPSTELASSLVPAAIAADDTSNQPAEAGEDQASGTPAIPDGVDVQALLNSLHTAPNAGATASAGAPPPAEGMTVATTHSPSQAQLSAPGAASSPLSASASAMPTGLPPRPPPQEQPLIHPNYVHSQHIRDYHPHAVHPAVQGHTRSDSTGGNPAVPPVNSPPASTGSQLYPQATPLSATTQFQSPVNAPQASPLESRRENYLASGAPLRQEDAPWTPDTQRKYDQFIETERTYVQEGRWEQFPQGSRLFVGTRDLNGRKTTYEEDRLNALAGNLSSEKVTKRDIFHVFHNYGELAQISIKQAYGFVQFFNAEDCARALAAQQGKQIRDKRIHLEISKPQKNRPGVSNRRSRSPDYGRGSNAGSTDRYAPGSRNGPRGLRDGYRPSLRSPSPRGYRDRYEDRYRQRSPQGYGAGGRYRRSPSPRHDPDDDLPLPRRAAKDVPDLQIIVLDNLDRDFIAWVERAFTSRSVRVDVLMLSPRLSEQAVVKRQILEGVLAVSKVTHGNQNSGRIGLQVFDRRAGASNVKFEEYDGLEPTVAVELVLRAKQTAGSPAVPAYGGYGSQPAYGAPQPPPPQHNYGYGAAPQPQTGYPPYQQPPPLSASATAPPNLQHLITSLDPSGLQHLLSAMGSHQQTPASATPHSSTSGYPGGASYGQQQQDALAALRNNPAMVGALQQQYQNQQQQQQQTPAHVPQSAAGGPVNMQDILARLGNSGR